MRDLSRQRRNRRRLETAQAFSGVELEQATVGILLTALLAPILAAVALAPRRGVRSASPCPAR